jgi:hypothetical protein
VYIVCTKRLEIGRDTFGCAFDGWGVWYTEPAWL